jgi:predicted DNA-binding protein (MmcQ/YjbR family)
MITEKEVHAYLAALPDSQRTYPFGSGVAVYKTNEKMFALVAEGSKPVSLSLKCDPELALTLRERYETVMPGYHLNKKHWNTILLSGQLEWQQVTDLIRHSHELVSGMNTK